MRHTLVRRPVTLLLELRERGLVVAVVRHALVRALMTLLLGYAAAV